MASLVGALVRTAVIVAVIGVYLAVLSNSDSTDPLGAGLLAFLILVVVAFGWAFVDGLRLGLVPAFVGWLLAAALSGLALPVAVGLANDGELALDLEDAVFFAILLFIPALAGLAIGGAVHGIRDRDKVAG